jgi:hypothetical protein
MKLSLSPKLVEKTSLGSQLVISFCKIFIPSYAFDALVCRNWPFSPSNRLTLRITLLSEIYDVCESPYSVSKFFSFVFFWQKVHLRMRNTIVEEKNTNLAINRTFGAIYVCE